mgnify:CR=1 FL=1
MYSIFHIDGGIGKNILATSVISSLKKSDPDRNIIIVSGWPQVWFNNPNVYEIYSFSTIANFYKNFIKEKDVKIFRQEPYYTEDYLLKKSHLIESWCKMIGIKWDKSSPKIYLSPLEIEYAKINLLKDVTKPIMIIQSNGGSQNNIRPYSWYRDLSYDIVKEVVDHYKNDYTIFQMGYKEQVIVDGCLKLSGELREMMAAFLFSNKRLLIDSFGQHTCAALGLKSVVCWIGNDPDVLGYKSNINLLPSANKIFDTLHSSYLEDADISGNPIQYPYDTLDLFKSKDIITALES